MLAQGEPEDLLKFGLIPEFVGRLPVIATLEDLDIDALVTILQEPKNALVKQYRKLFELEDVGLTFNDDALKAIAQKAIERKTGARGLRSIVENILLDTMFDLPDFEGVDEVVIDKDVVAGNQGPGKSDREKCQDEEGRCGLSSIPILTSSEHPVFHHRDHKCFHKSCGSFQNKLLRWMQVVRMEGHIFNFAASSSQRFEMGSSSRTINP